MPRIVHLGLGNFHRAHQAWYTAKANALTGEAWRITGVRMRRRDLAETLAASGGRYTLGLRSEHGLQVETIGVHDHVLVAADDAEGVITAIADPDCHIVTLTITEKGYAPGSPAMVLLARALEKRAASGAPLTLLSCDNVPENGQVLKQSLAETTMMHHLQIAAHISENMTFPSSMVDRITPATTSDGQAEFQSIADTPVVAPVITEGFSEWVIEDHFAGPRPAWDKVGVRITGDIAPFEARKLLFLNAAHSLLAYGGLLRGHTYVADAIADPMLRAKVEGLWDAATAAVPASIRDDLPDYRAALVKRFSVPAMRHRLDQIAQDGSQKAPIRLLPILEASAAPAARDAIAAWIAYLVRFAGTGDIAADPGLEPLLQDANGPGGIIANACRHLGLDAQTQSMSDAVARWLAP